MEPLIVAGLVLVAVLAGVFMRLRMPPGTPERRGKPRSMDALDTVTAWPPQATRVLTPAERKAWSVLRTALPDHIVLAQVPLSRFMKVPTRNSYSEWLRRVGLMSADIVVCDADSQVIAVIDVRASDGKEHARARQRHARMDRVIAAAGIPIHVWHESTIPSPATARDLLLSASARVAAGAGATTPAPRLTEPVEADAVLDAELARRDPPPSTWFDNLDTAAVPLGNMPAAAPARSAGAPSARQA